MAIALGMKLTARELQIINLIAEGKRDKEIAYETGLKSGTVRGVIHVLCAKLGAPNRVAAAVNYVRWKAKEDEDGLVP